MGEEHATHLVELDVFHAAVLIVGDGAQKTGDDTLAHDRLLGVHRVQKLNGLAETLKRQAQTLDLARLGERVGHRLVHAAGAQRIVDLVLHVLLVAHRAEAAATAGKRGLDLIHAVEAQHLLVEVDLTRKVGAERR